jgi:hypothetical protein
MANEPDEVWYGDLAMELTAGRLTPFLGAGVNLVGVDRHLPFQPGLRLPDAAELAMYLATRRRYELKPGETPELIKVAQSVSSRLGRAPLYDDLHQLFDHDFPPTPVHDVLARMPEYLRDNQGLEYPLMITTNYDDALERAFRARGEPFDVLTYVATGKNLGSFLHLDPTGSTELVKEGKTYDAIDLTQRTVILKLHGAVWRAAKTALAADSYVVTEDDYIESMTGDVMDALPHSVGARMEACHYLFLGYSLRDWNLRAMLRRIWKEHDGENKSWAVEREADEVEVKAWRDRDVDILEIDLGVFVEALSNELFPPAQAVG